MSLPAGRVLPVSLPRRIVCDLMHFSLKIPTVTIGRVMPLAEVAQARQQASPRPSWCAIFTKAYALAAAGHPELRRSFLSFPRPRLYECACNIAAIVVERRLDTEDTLLLAPLVSPENQSLQELDGHLRGYRERPVTSVGAFRRALRIARLPRPLRRLLWWIGFNVSGRQRAQYFGTFGVTTVAGEGADSLRPLSPWTTLLHYGVIDKQGIVNMRLTFDHRVLDGTIPARVLAEMETALKGPILSELRLSATGKAA